MLLFLSYMSSELNSNNNVCFKNMNQVKDVLLKKMEVNVVSSVLQAAGVLFIISRTEGAAIEDLPSIWKQSELEILILTSSEC